MNALQKAHTGTLLCTLTIDTMVKGVKCILVRTEITSYLFSENSTNVIWEWNLGQCLIVRYYLDSHFNSEQQKIFFNFGLL